MKKREREKEGSPGGVKGAEGGSVLIPSICMLSLISLLILGIMEMGGMKSSIAAELAKRSQARQAALSGIEIAYNRLSEDLDYRGESCTPLPGSSAAVDISVADLGDHTYEVTSAGTFGGAESAIRTTAGIRQAALDYPLTVGGSMILNGPDPAVLSDCFVQDVIWAKCGGIIAGNLYLAGERQITYNGSGDPVSVDGYDIPTIGGAIYTRATPPGFPTVDFAALRDLAIQSGRLYSGNTMIKGKDLEGVVYVENAQNLHIKDDTTIHGVLVCDNVRRIHILNGNYKIIQDESVCPFTAILAPGSELHINPNVSLDVFGLTLMGSADFHGNGTFTGPVFIERDLRTFPHTELLCQTPSCMYEFLYNYIDWNGYDIIELGYEEL